MKTKGKPKKPAKRKVRRVVLGTGHPWFIYGTANVRAYVGLSQAQDEPSDVRLEFGDLGNYNKIRLVAEVLK